MRGGYYEEKGESIIVVVFVHSVAIPFFKCRSTEEIGVNRPRDTQFHTSLNARPDHKLCDEYYGKHHLIITFFQPPTPCLNGEMEGHQRNLYLYERFNARVLGVSRMT